MNRCRVAEDEAGRTGEVGVETTDPGRILSRELGFVLVGHVAGHRSQRHAPQHLSPRPVFSQ